MTRTSTAALDYYVVQPETGLLVEEFVLADDLSAVRLRSAGWTPPRAGWWSSADFARAVRVDRRLRARLRAVDRPAAEATYRRLSGAALPDEEALRAYFSDDIPLASGEPLRLGGGREVHRVLFAGEPDGDVLDRLCARLRLADVATADGVRPGVLGTGRLRVGDTVLCWDLRRVGGGAAWSIDVTSEPAGGDALRGMLRRLTDVARHHGLVPTMVDRLS
jgi:hypothetical protein